MTAIYTIIILLLIYFISKNATFALFFVFCVVVQAVPFISRQKIKEEPEPPPRQETEEEEEEEDDNEILITP